MGPSDAKLAQRCLKGDARAWESVVNSLNSRIYNMAYRYSGRFDLAEELTQDIFLKVFQNLTTYRPETGPLRNWVMRVGRNHIIDSYRAAKYDRKTGGSDELEVVQMRTWSSETGPFENLQQQEKAEFLMEGLEKLTTELKEAVVLRDIEELSYQEIADLVGIPVGTVKSRINRGRIELARVLKKSQRPVPPPSGAGSGHEEARS